MPGEADEPAESATWLSARPGAVEGRLADHLDGHHPAVAGLAVAAAGLVGVAAALVGVGLTLVHLPGPSALTSGDTRLERWFEAHHGAATDRLTAVGSTVAATQTVLGVAAVVVVLLLGLRRGREALFLVLALAVEVLGFLVTTLLVDRDRPPVRHLDRAPPTSAFPSGHTAAAVALYLGSALLVSAEMRRAAARMLARVVGGLVPVFVGVSRLSRGMHQPTDVVGGMLLGLAALAVALLAVRATDAVARHRAAAPHRPHRTAPLRRALVDGPAR